MKQILLKTMLLLCAIVAGGSAWGQNFTIGSTPLSSVSDGDQVVWGTSNSNLVYLCESNWLKCNETSSDWIIFTVESATGGFYLKTPDNKYVYSSAAKKVELHATSKTLFTIANSGTHSNIVYNNSVGYYTLNSTGIRPYSSSLYTDAHLYLVTYSTPTHTITYSATNGTIAGVDAGNNAVATGASVAEGATVTLTATASPGYVFSSWAVSGTGSTLTSTNTNPTTFTMGTANATITANFTSAVSDYINVSPTTSNVTCDDQDVEFSVNTNQTLNVDPTQFYTTADGTVTTSKPDWITEVIYDEGELLISVDANMGAARTAYFRVENGNVKSEVITINQAAKPYAISVDDNIPGGTISADKENAVAGETVTLTSNPATGYSFSAWTVLDDNADEVTVINNQFTMPACEVYVSATFNALPTHAITCVATPVSGGTVTASPASAYAGQTVTLTVTPEEGEGYSLGETTATYVDGNNVTQTLTITNNTFTMPDYAVTVTATFLSNTYEGAFVQYSGALTEGDYILVYDNKAMNNDNTTNSSKLQYTTVEPSNNVISNPDRSIVWHIAKSETSGYWTIYNEISKKYVSGAGSKTNLTLVGSISDNTKWSVSGTGTYDFRTKANEGNNERYILYSDDNEVYGNYASSNGEPVTLYKLVSTTISSAEFATFITPMDVDFTQTDGLTAYKAVSTGNGKVNLTKVEKAPAETPLVLNGSERTYTLQAATGTLDDVSDNLLAVSGNGNVVGNGNIYVLANIEKEVGFYQLAVGVTLPANKVYLNVASADVKFLNFSFDTNEADGIEAIEKAGMGEGSVYDLQGRRLSVQGALPKGVYIVNGKKVMVK